MSRSGHKSLARLHASLITICSAVWMVSVPVLLNVLDTDVLPDREKRMTPTPITPFLPDASVKMASSGTVFWAVSIAVSLFGS